MGGNVLGLTVTGHQRQEYRDKMQRCLDAMARMLAGNAFSFDRQHIGMEIELCLVDEQMSPAMANGVVLEKINDPSFTKELSQHNLELNVPPRPLAGEHELRAVIGNADAKAGDAGAALVLIGTLPTLRPMHFHRRWLSAASRYEVLNDRILAARGEPMMLDLEGVAVSVAVQVGRTVAAVHAEGAVHGDIRMDNCRSYRTISPRTGTPRRRWPACRWRWRRTRRSCSARRCGTSRASRCFCRPPTPARSTCRRCSASSSSCWSPGTRRRRRC